MSALPSNHQSGGGFLRDLGPDTLSRHNTTLSTPFPARGQLKSRAFKSEGHLCVRQCSRCSQNGTYQRYPLIGGKPKVVERGNESWVIIPRPILHVYSCKQISGGSAGARTYVGDWHPSNTSTFRAIPVFMDNHPRHWIHRCWNDSLKNLGWGNWGSSFVWNSKTLAIHCHRSTHCPRQVPRCVTTTRHRGRQDVSLRKWYSSCACSISPPRCTPGCQVSFASIISLG